MTAIAIESAKSPQSTMPEEPGIMPGETWRPRHDDRVSRGCGRQSMICSPLDRPNSAPDPLDGEITQHDEVLVTMPMSHHNAKADRQRTRRAGQPESAKTAIAEARAEDRDGVAHRSEQPDEHDQGPAEVRRPCAEKVRKGLRPDSPRRRYA